MACVRTTGHGYFSKFKMNAFPSFLLHRHVEIADSFYFFNTRFLYTTASIFNKEVYWHFFKVYVLLNVSQSSQKYTFLLTSCKTNLSVKTFVFLLKNKYTPNVPACTDKVHFKIICLQSLIIFLNKT